MSSSSYLLKTQARSMVAHVGDDGSHGFLVGTASLKGPNDVRLLRYAEDDDEIACVAAYGHPGEVVSMAACPVDPALLVTVQNAQPGFTATLWRMPGLPGLDDDGAAAADGGDNTSSSNGIAPQRDLQAVAQFPGAQPAARVRCVAWAPVAGDAAFSRRSAETSLQLASLEDSSLRAYTLKGDGSLAGSGPAVALPDVTFSGGLAWDPHRPGEVAVAADSSVHVWDVRTRGDRLRSLVHAVPPGLCVRALSWNPNKPWHLATAGDDFRVKVWDMRRLGGAGTGGSGAAATVPASVTPVKVLDGHTHWVTTVAFNPFHDQLLLSGGSDGRAALWRISSISSAPLLELGDVDIDPDTGRKVEPKQAPDAAIRTHDDDHDDSVVAAAWSPHNAWVYASLSYGGRLVVAQVPSAEKYRVLL